MHLLLLKIKGHGDTCIDMVANNFHYHRSCMNRYTTRRTPNDKGSSELATHEEAFSTLADEISEGLLNKKHVYSINQLSKRYNALLPQYGKRRIRDVKKQPGQMIVEVDRYLFMQLL